MEQMGEPNGYGSLVVHQISTHHFWPGAPLYWLARLMDPTASRAAPCNNPTLHSLTPHLVTVLFSVHLQGNDICVGDFSLSTRSHSLVLLPSVETHLPISTNPSRPVQSTYVECPFVVTSTIAITAELPAHV